MRDNKIRKAVGAIIFQNDKYLLVHKVKSNNDENGYEEINPTWDLPKGGIDKLDINSEDAVLRELKEETGSEAYRIISKFHERICFDFPENCKYRFQETIMYYVEYLGNKEDLKPQDEEIDDIRFFNKDEVMKVIKLGETIEFLNRVNW